MAEHKKSGIGGLFTAGLLGAVAGAATVFFSQEKNRKLTKKLVDNTKKIGAEKLAQAKEELNKVKKTSAKKLVEKLDEAQKKLEKEAGKK